MKTSYTRAEADEILRRALAEQTEGDISHEDLVAAAREVGIPEASIEAAADRLGDHRELQHQIALLRRRKRRAFVRHLVVFTIINAGIFAFDWFDGGPWFFQFPLIVWGVVLTLFALIQLAPNPESLARRAERELEKQRRREAARRKRLAKGDKKTLPPGAAMREFEAAVEQGVSTLLSAATRAIRGMEGKRIRVEGDGPAAQPPDQEEEQRRQRVSRP